MLTFTSQRNNVDTDAKFDNISLAAAVPEPGTLMLIGLGLGALGLLRKRA